MRRRWIMAVLAALALTVAGCTSGPAGGGGSDPRDVLLAGAEPLAGGGSAHVRSSLSLSLTGAPGGSLDSEGTVSWQGAGGTTGELTVPSVMGGTPAPALFTENALYVDAGAIGSMGGAPPALAGKKWIKQSYAGVEQDFGPLGKVITAGIRQTNPVRSAALLVQSPDLREVGQEQINGVATRHYSGTVRFTDLAEDLRLGLDRQTLDAVRSEITATGGTDTQQYDLWVDDQGRPIRAQGRSGQESYSVDYSDYGPPRPVQDPPADQVVDKEQIMSGLGLPN